MTFNRFAAKVLCLCMITGMTLMGCTRHEAVSVKVVAKRYEYDPAVIRVKQGQDVTIHLISADVPHGFKVPDLGLEAKVTPGTITEVKFRARAKGEFPFQCNVICGPMHDMMSGKLIVE